MKTQAELREKEIWREIDKEITIKSLKILLKLFVCMCVIRTHWQQ